MAEQEVANLEVRFEVNAEDLKAGIRAAQKELRGMMGTVGGLSQELGRAESALSTGANAHKALSQMGIRTTASVNAEIAALEKLEASLQGDAHAVGQVIQRKEALQASLQRTEQATNRAASANHRANLFMINFSRGVEDLKFGLPAVINNLEGIALGYQMMAKEAEAADKKVSSVLFSALASPAGMIALLNLVITTAFILGPTLQKAFNKGRVGAKALKKAVDEMFETPAAAEPRSFFGPANIAEAEQFLAIVERRADAAKATVKEMFGSLSGVGAVQGMRLRDLMGLNDEDQERALEQYEIYKAMKEQAESVRVTMDAQAAAAEVMARNMREVAPRASLNAEQKRLKEIEEQLDSTADAYQSFGEKRVRDLLLEQRTIENHLEYIEVLKTAEKSMSRLRAEADFLAQEHENLGYALMSVSTASQIAAANIRVLVADAYNEATIAVKQFRVEQALALGDRAVGGIFEGLFGSLRSADADKARLSIIGLNKEFSSLEESLAKGEISYQEFSIKNRMRIEELRAAQRELADATRTTFELMVERIDNAFDGLKRSVKMALAEIAQEYVRLFVRRGIAKLIGNAILPGLGTGSIEVLGGGIAGTFGSQTMARVAIAPAATVIPSGDIQVSLRQASVTSTRTGV